MSNAAITEEITDIRRMLSSLQSRLYKLESAITPTPPKPTGVQSKPPFISKKSSKNNRSALLSSSVPEPATKQDFRTLRSRSFRVMRHLINVVDASFLDQEPQKKSKPDQKSETSQKQSPPKTNVIKGDSGVLSSFLNHSQSDQTVQNPSRARVQEVKIKTASKSATDYHSPRIFHPKRPCKDAKTPSQAISSCSEPPRNDVIALTEQTKANAIERTSPCLDYKPPTAAAKSIPQPVNTDPPEKTNASLFQSDHLKKNSNRFDLLKLDPVFSDLLPLSWNDYTCITTNLATQIKKLPRASSSLVKQQTLGVWEWREGTSTAKLYGYYKFCTPGDIIDKRRFKYVGWAWKGQLDQQPPKIQDLPGDISQGCDTLRWYWFKDLWLLFYFDWFDSPILFFYCFFLVVSNVSWQAQTSYP